MTEDYDWREDALKSWQLAIAEKRRQGLIEGRFQPRNDEEREMINATKEEHSPAATAPSESIQPSGAPGRPVEAGPIKSMTPPERLDLAKSFVTMQNEEGLTASQIAIRFHLTRNQVCGMVHRARILLGMRRPTQSYLPRSHHKRRETPSLASLDGAKPAPRPRKPKLPKAVPEPPKAIGGAFHILDLGARQCRFPTASKGDEHLFCGAFTARAESWCPEHRARVFQPLAPRAKVSYSEPPAPLPAR